MLSWLEVQKSALPSGVRPGFCKNSVWISARCEQLVAEHGEPLPRKTISVPTEPFAFILK
jgi:hypothetical protein